MQQRGLPHYSLVAAAEFLPLMSELEVKASNGMPGEVASKESEK